jgi:hypothetical protein
LPPSVLKFSRVQTYLRRNDPYIFTCDPRRNTVNFSNGEYSFYDAKQKWQHLRWVLTWRAIVVAAAALCSEADIMLCMFFIVYLFFLVAPDAWI